MSEDRERADKAELRLAFLLSAMCYDHNEETWVLRTRWYGDPPKGNYPTLDEKKAAIDKGMENV
jgi:hypothetical protein